jgi:hypothetical protein
MLNKLKNIFKKKEEPKKEVKKEPKSKKVETLSPKEQATKDNEPYIAITKVEVDPSNINAGAFDLDWNDKFVINLIKAGYKQRDDDTDQIIVDRWFQTVCRNVALEMYEQQQADPENRDGMIREVRTRDIGNGRREVS